MNFVRTPRHGTTHDACNNWKDMRNVTVLLFWHYNFGTFRWPFLLLSNLRLPFRFLFLLLHDLSTVYTLIPFPIFTWSLYYFSFLLQSFTYPLATPGITLGICIPLIGNHCFIWFHKTIVISTIPHNLPKNESLCLNFVSSSYSRLQFLRTISYLSF